MKQKNIEDIYELSPLQQGMLFHTLVVPHSGVYFEQFCYALQTRLNVPAFKKAWQRVLDRHPILRTSFYWENLDKPYQVVYRQVDLPWEFQDWRQLSLQEREKQLEVFLAGDRKRGFVLSEVPLIRLALIQEADNSYQFVFSFHHILMEGWSLTWLWKEFYEFYNAFCKGEDLHLEYPRPFKEYICWLQQQDISKAETFWRETLKGFTVPTPLIMDKASGTFSSQDEDHDCQQTLLSETTTAALNSLARKYHLTLNILLKGAWAILLSRYSTESDIVFGATSSGRPTELAEAESMMGLFANTLPLRVQVPGDAFVIPWLKKLQIQEAEMRQYEYSPLMQIQQWSQIPRGLPLFETLLVFNNYLVDSTREKLAQSMVIGEARIFEKTNYPLTLQVYPGSDLLLSIGYDTRRFDSASIVRILGHLKTLLESIVANPEQQLGNLPILTSQENYQLLLEWNNTEVDYPHKCIHELFEAQVERTPNAVAVVFEDEQLTYRDLNIRANQLAHYLQQLGVKPEVLVGICVKRSLDMIIGLLAILKAGGAYVPLDPSYPQQRLAFILEDAQVPVLLTQASLMEAMPQHKAKVVCLDTDWHLIAQQSKKNLFSQLTTDNLAYVIYTSGSTGKPKGVQIPHKALNNFLYSMRQKPGLTEEDTLLAVTTYSFDIAALELFLPLIVGARLVIASREVASDGTQLSATLIESKATVMQATPATWQLLLATGWGGNHQLKILCGGEALPAHLAHQLRQRCHSLWNMYGPTETTIWSAASEVEADSQVIPISHPIANTQLYILDQYNQLVPVGVAGELHIGGEGLARGYFHRPDLTAEKFIPNPFSKEAAARLYKTGDKARYLPNGEIEFIGRIDHQVKVRGFRIELGEIEALISQYPAVRETVVVVRDDSVDSQRIVGYVVPQKEQTLTIPELRSFLESKLPNYMIPATFVTLEALPLTPNGKVNRKALPAPELTQISSSNHVPPATPIENLLAGIWAEILGIDKVGIHDNFFELGGHSLIATRVISQIRQVFQVELALRCLFEKPTIAKLAKEIEKAIKVGLRTETTNIEQIERSSELPLSFAQQRLWFLAQLEPNSPFYNIPAAVRLQGQLNLKALQQSFNEILRRHEALRTNFQAVEGQAVAVISKEKPLTLAILDISELPSNQQEVEVKQQTIQEAQQPFNLTGDLLLRVKLLRLDEQEHIVLLTMHHIASDGWSIGVLVRELATLYQAFCDEQPISYGDATRASLREELTLRRSLSAGLTPLTELPIQYVDFAAWQRQWLQAEALETQISYWRKHLENAPFVLELPTDHPRPAIQTFRGATYSFNLSKELSTALNKLSQQQRSTLFMTLLAAFQALLWRYTGQEDIVVGSPIANRNRAEIEGLIGFFVNTLVLRTNLAGNPSFEELLKRVREVALGAYAHQDLPFELLVEQLQPQRDLSHTPLFQVMFVLQNAPISALELPGLTLTPLESDSDSAKFDLTLYMSETQSGLVGCLEYNTDLFEESSIQRMMEHLQTLLSGIVANPQQRLSELPLLTEPEKHQLLREWNNTQVDYPQQECIHQLFEAQVERTPDAVAVVFEDEQLTYQELNARANQLAHYLRSLGVKPEVLVGICVERSLDMVIGLLAILKAGGAYIPLDPSYPQERLAYTLSDTQLPILLTQQSLVAQLPAHQAHIVCIDTHWDQISQQSQSNPVNLSTANNLAYVIYTSGSTGKPKGVLGLHQGAVNRFHWMWKTHPFTQGEVCCQKTSLNFVDSVWEIFGGLLQGIRTVIIPDTIVKAPQQFVETLGKNKVTRLVLVPSLLRVLLNTYHDLQERLPKLKLWVTSGEALSLDLLQNFRQTMPESTLLNLYGSSEVAADVTCDSINPQMQTPLRVTIGHPIANTEIYVLDKYLKPVALGVPGELYISGAGLARGYLNQPEITAERFIPNPFENSKFNRLYKTGDLVRYLPDGKLEFLGRIDHQVKLRGFRIELGEIEAVLSQHPRVQESIVVARVNEPDEQQLIAYVVPYPEQTFTSSEFYSLLKQKLPNYMIPSAFVILEALPLLPNGKVNRKALPIPNQVRPELEAVYQAPQTEVEKTIANIWQELLRIEEVGIHDNFFELGGHSLLLVQVHNKLQKALQRNFSLVELFQYPTINRLAKYLSQERKEQPSSLDNSHQDKDRTTSIKRRKEARQNYRKAKQKDFQP